MPDGRSELAAKFLRTREGVRGGEATIEREGGASISARLKFEAASAK
jgi:hypothetical protein